MHDHEPTGINEENPQRVYANALMLHGSQEGRCRSTTGGGLDSSHLDWIIQLLKSMRSMLPESEAQDQTFL